MPIAIIAGKPRCFHREYGADPAIADRRQKSTKTGTIVMAGSGNSQIFINYHNVTEAEFTGSVLQRVLPTIALLVVSYLLQARLPDIDVGSAFQMFGADFIVHRCVLLKA